MAQKTINNWLESVLENPNRVAVPLMTHPGIEICGKTVSQAVRDGSIQAQAIKAISAKYPTAAASVIMDLTVEAEAFGAEVIFPEDEIPSVVGRLLQSEDDIEKLQVPGLDKARVSEYLKANTLAVEAISDRPVLAGCIGPYSLAGRLYDMSEIMMLIYINPDAANLLLDKCTQFLITYCKALKQTGAAGVVMAEPAAGLLSNEDCEQYSSVFVKRIVDEVQDKDFAVILHNCGNTGHCTKAMVATGAKALHFGNKADMTQVMADVPSDIIAMGNLDPVSMFKSATPDQMYKATSELLEAMSDHRNFVLSSGCDTPPHTPFENIDAFFQALKDYNNR